MSKYTIIANNTCDLPKEITKNLDVTFLNLGFTIGEENYKEMPAKEFYQKMREGAMPTTNAANVGEYTDLFEAALSAGDDVLCLAFSSALSTTYNSAVIAAEEVSEKYPDRKIYVVDTRSAGLGEGILVRGAAEQKAAGKSMEEVRDWVEATKNKVIHYFTVDDLGHLKRGGRISGAQAVMGGMLGIKPILRVDETGGMVPADKARGRAAALKKMVDYIGEKGVNIQDQTVYITHSDCLEDAENFAAQVKAQLGVKDIVISFVGPVIGSHTGLGVLGIFCLAEAR